jgi:hypothetical protein
MGSTGHIHRVEEIEQAQKKRKDLVSIPDDQVDAVARMNRSQRRKWYAEERRRLKRAAKTKG